MIVIEKKARARANTRKQASHISSNAETPHEMRNTRRFPRVSQFPEVNLVPRVLSLPPSRKQPRPQGLLPFWTRRRPWGRGCRESTLVSVGHVSPLSKQLPTRVGSLFFKRRREKRMQIFSNWHEDRGMEVISSLFSKDRDAEKIYSLLSAAFQKHK